VAVADACTEVQNEAHYVTRCAGGQGAVREVIELILNCQGLWQKVIERFREGKNP
jgi:3-deoxy-D-manno-octulosonate 8-phosphate phosphatase (KDO 8-P phosphatase)